jgi:hypothetical protein
VKYSRPNRKQNNRTIIQALFNESTVSNYVDCILEGVCQASGDEYYYCKERSLKPMPPLKNKGAIKPDYEIRRKDDDECVFIIEVKKLFKI